MNIALFDFDGTITFKDTFSDFIHFAVESKRILAGTVALSPLIVGYKLGIVTGSRLRQSIVKFGLRAEKVADIRRKGSEYASAVMPKWIRPNALERIEWHKSQGDTVVVVSAGLEIYLRDWCTQIGVDLISTELETTDGILTGRYAGGDCTGNEKRRRALAKYDIDRYAIVYAYGDTHEDDEMLSLAHKKYFRWNEIAG